MISVSFFGIRILVLPAVFVKALRIFCNSILINIYLINECISMFQTDCLVLQYNSVIKVTGCGLDKWVWSPSRGRDFSFHHHMCFFNHLFVMY